MFSRRRINILLFATAFIVLFYLCSYLSDPPSTRLRSSPSSQFHHSKSQDVSGLQPTQPEPSSTFGMFSRVFVVSRPTRMDRRTTMEQLRTAFGIDWTYVDGISFDDPVVEDIENCIRSNRKSNQLRRFQWPLDDDIETIVRSSSFDLHNASHWARTCGRPVHRDFSANLPSTGDSSASATSHFAHGSRTHSPLTCAVQDRTHGVRYKPSLPSHMLLIRPKLACWYSHIDAIIRVAAFGEPLVSLDRARGAALILEDDIDMERDIQVRLAELWEVLPHDWDIMFLGHCWSDESRHPALRNTHKSRTSGVYPHMALHPSSSPKCTHAYALSRAGARRLLLHLLHPPFAYSRALDQAFAWLVQSRRLKAFSVVPSIVVQHKLWSSDIDGGENGLGSGWKESLEHGFFQS